MRRAVAVGDAGSTSAVALVPSPVASDILRNHRDVLRVGCLTLGGRRVEWSTGTEVDDAQQFEEFLEAFIAGLRQEQELKALSTENLARVALWFCKAVSINYVFADVLELLERTVGVRCSIETCDPGGRGFLVEYRADVERKEGRLNLRVSLVWDGTDNLVYRKAGSKKREVKGTVSHIETTFALPPEPGSSPDYSLKVSLPKAQRFLASPGVGKSPASSPVADSHRLLLLTASTPLEEADVKAEEVGARKEKERLETQEKEREEALDALKRAAEAETRRKAEVKKKAEAERRRKAEAKRKAEEAEAEKKALEEAKLRAEEEARRKVAEEARRTAEEEKAKSLTAAAADLRARLFAEAEAYWGELGRQRDAQDGASSDAKRSRRRSAHDNARTRAVAIQLARAEQEQSRFPSFACCRRWPAQRRDEDDDEPTSFIV